MGNPEIQSSELSGIDPAETLVAGVSWSLLTAWCVSWALYVFGAPAGAFWILPILALAGLVVGRGSVAALARDPEARGLATGQLLVTGWCLALLPFVQTFSAGTWAGDWHEHWERALFFLNRWPLDYKFLRSYSLASRPPLANMLTAAFLGLTREDFPRYQGFMAAFSSLAYLPAALLARRFGGRGAPAVLAVLFLVNPLFVANTAFPWTKLPAAFFTLVGLYFFLRFRDGGPGGRVSAITCAVSLAAGIITHYSAAPYAVFLVGAWIALGWPRRNDIEFRRTTLLAAAAGIAVALTWFAWSLANYGLHGTAFSNTSITELKTWQGSQTAKIALNLRDTLVPHFIRWPDRSLIDQTSPWGLVRDWAFQAYQQNFPFALGCVAWLAAAREAIRAGRGAAARDRRFWIAFVASITVLGVAVHGSRNPWGLAHICLQTLVLAGLAFLAGRWEKLERGWKWAIAAGASVDFALGIALHFAVQDFALDRWLTPERPFAQVAASFSLPSQWNLNGKIVNRLVFVADVSRVRPPLVVALLACILVLAIERARRPVAPTSAAPQSRPCERP